jgi:NAD(P)H dehydrogenase (quinone)
MKNILVIHGHPVRDTFIDCLKDSYIESARLAGAEVRELVLRELQFEINFREGYRGNQPLEPDLVHAQQQILWANHLVFFYPNWWATYPAQLKGFIDRTLLPGFAFKYTSNGKPHLQLLKGKTARLVVTMDSSVWYYYLIMKAPGHHSMRKAILEFCGIKPVRINSLGSMRKSTEKQRLRWINRMKKYGSNMN